MEAEKTRGVPIWQAAGYLGMSSQILERTYGHHHPDYTRRSGDHLETIAERRLEIAGTAGERFIGYAIG